MKKMACAIRTHNAVGTIKDGRIVYAARQAAAASVRTIWAAAVREQSKQLVPSGPRRSHCCSSSPAPTCIHRSKTIGRGTRRSDRRVAPSAHETRRLRDKGARRRDSVLEDVARIRCEIDGCRRPWREIGITHGPRAATSVQGVRGAASWSSARGAPQPTRRARGCELETRSCTRRAGVGIGYLDALRAPPAVPRPMALTRCTADGTASWNLKAAVEPGRGPSEVLRPV